MSQQQLNSCELARGWVTDRFKSISINIAHATYHLLFLENGENSSHGRVVGVFLFIKTDFPEIICLFEVDDLCLVVVY